MPATGHFFCIRKLDKPSEESKGFAKTDLLKSGASQTITIALTAKDLASFNTNQSAWITDAGNNIVKACASSEDIKLTKDIVVKKVNKALVLQVTINELKK